jgi:hypothetical protein
MERKKFTIAVLTATAALLGAAHWLVPQPTARAEAVVKDRDYQVVTCRIQNGGDALYVLDNRSGQIAVFIYDPGARAVRPMAVRNVADAFVVR